MAVLAALYRDVCRSGDKTERKLERERWRVVRDNFGGNRASRSLAKHKRAYVSLFGVEVSGMRVGAGVLEERGGGGAEACG